MLHKINEVELKAFDDYFMSQIRIAVFVLDEWFQASQSPEEVSISGEAKLKSSSSHFIPSLVRMSLLWVASISDSAWLCGGKGPPGQCKAMLLI